ncbi:cleavage and polyadenylation specific factor 2 [Paracoccidioides lutzii Pb01]|uniref:Cleavage and polyadenylation specificity factor subunit 2 n=1 Tax=Paracoccidioides lutzii (strain ATCC MYA-826 / Pb01) TaxID=502779 RepID=C1HAV2_PARBA|nr:cleavage and polyadenylation specific factor 2 [Paracoccidioides lutzii Pb01]EEH37513.2 cleavage and polyadenylation specific factor 2 [Paracoccidioides lutzii Pb01]
MFTFTPLLGAQSSSSRAVQSILELDGGVKILVDVGWDHSFDTSALAELERQIPTLSLILLTHATPSHIGAFAHCCKTFPLFTQIPVYATSPVIAFGRSLLQDLYASAPLAATFWPPATAGASSPTSAAASRAAISPESADTDQNERPRILLPPPSTEEIARYFSLIQPLKYSQPHQPLPSPFSPPLNGLTLTAYNAGHTVGGTIWHIQHGMESIIYAVDWNQARENVIAGASWFGGSGGSGTEVVEQLRKPTALVCSTRGGDKLVLSGGRKRRDDLLLDMLRSCFSKGGTVLIPMDTSARVLELAYVLEHAWRESAETADGEDPLKGVGLYLAGRKAHGTMRLARSMLEWMDEGIVREFEAGHGRDPVTGGGKGRSDGPSQRNAPASIPDKKGDNASKGLGPFTFRHLKIVERKTKLDKILGSNAPQVILTSDTSLEWGYSKHVLQKIAAGSENLIILTEPYPISANAQSTEDGGSRSSLAHKIWSIYEERRDGVASEKTASGELLEQVHSGGSKLSVTDVEKSALDASELLMYQQYLATQRQLQNTSQGIGDSGLENTADTLDDGSSSSSSEDSDSEQQGKVLNVSVSLGHSNRNKLGLSDADLGVNILLRRKNVHDYDVRGKKGRERMFPYVAPKKRGDEYGEFIRPEEYLRAEEREEAEMQTQRGPDGRIQTRLGPKRRWGELNANGKQPPNANKRQHVSPGTGDLQDISGDLALAGGLGINGTENASSSEEDTEEQPVEGPSKVIFVHSTLELNARIAFVDFAGLHDKRSLEMLIPLIQPRKLILTAGLKDETMALAAECRNLLTAKAGIELGLSSESVVDIFTPAPGETVDASVDTNAWMVKLSKGLVKLLKWQNVRSLGVVALMGELRGPEPASDDENGPEMSQKKQKMLLENSPGTGENKQNPLTPKKDSFPLLDVLPANMAAATRSVTRPLHVGDLRLADLRKLMQSSGHTAEFRGEGTLLIDGFVAVRKSGIGKIEIEGAAQSALSNRSAVKRAEGSFLAVKKKIYEGLAIVAGG